MDLYEEEYECIEKNIKISKENYNISILSLKSNKEESPNISKNNNLNLSKENEYSENNNKKDLIDNKILFDLTDKIYNKEEHLNKMLFKKKNSSQNNLLHLKYSFPSNNSPQNDDKKTSVSKMGKNGKIYRKSLFHEVNIKNKLEEEKVDNSQKIKASLLSKKPRKKNNEFDAFFKLKLKMKKPPKDLYLENIIINRNNSKINNSFNRTENKQNTIKSINTIKTFNKEIIFKTKKFEDEINKKEDKTEKKIHNKDKNNHEIEENKNKNKIQIQIKQLVKTEKKTKSIKKIKCIPFHLCCLKYIID